mmetsp:Transcript_29872/g.76056  ORF Transcript_29872/g.76056 Transcript_29872/m.76056 type:complete len:290 (+) Transcript_29872:805-1674(+)
MGGVAAGAGIEALEPETAVKATRPWMSASRVRPEPCVPGRASTVPAGSSTKLSCCSTCVHTCSLALEGSSTHASASARASCTPCLLAAVHSEAAAAASALSTAGALCASEPRDALSVSTLLMDSSLTWSSAALSARCCSLRTSADSGPPPSPLTPCTSRPTAWRLATADSMPACCAAHSDSAWARAVTRSASPALRGRGLDGCELWLRCCECECAGCWDAESCLTAAGWLPLACFRPCCSACCCLRLSTSCCSELITLRRCSVSVPDSSAPRRGFLAIDSCASPASDSL